MHRPVSRLPVARAAVALAVAGLAAGCAARGVDPRPTAPSPPPETVSETAPAPTIDQAAAEEVVGRVAEAIAEIRGLELLRPVPVEVVDDAAARDHMTRRVEIDGRLERFRATERAHRALGLVPEGLDTLEALMSAIEEQAGGFYDPETGRYYLLDDMPAAMTSVITAHEMVHALEDQHHDLEARIRASEDSDDRAFAAAAVHEGSAMLAMSVYAAREMLAGRLDPSEMEIGVPDDALRALPAVLVRQLAGVYVLGMRFMARGNPAGALAGGYPVEDAARVYADGPVSSEQILHPEKYWDPALRDDPVEVRIPDLAPLLGADWTRDAKGDLGELTLAVLADPDASADVQAAALAGPAVWSNDAARGWGGDAWESWSRDGATGVAVLVAWDLESDAVEFLDAIAGRDVLVARRAGDRVALVAGFPAPLAEALLGRMLE